MKKQTTAIVIASVFTAASLFSFSSAFAGDRDVWDDLILSAYNTIQFDRDLGYENPDYNFK